MTQLKPSYDRLKAIFYASLTTSILNNEAAFASLQSISEKSTQIKDLITGPLGSAVLIGGSVGGIVGALLKGNTWVAFAIFIVGVVASLHIENINGLFTQGQ